LTLRVSELTLSIVVEEVKSVAVDANAGLVEERAVFMSILASSLGMGPVSFDAGNASSPVLVVFLTILILDLANGLTVEDVALIAS